MELAPRRTVRRKKTKMEKQEQVTGPVKTRTQVDAIYLAELIQEIVEEHPELGRVALQKMEARPEQDPDRLPAPETGATAAGLPAIDPEVPSAKGELPPVTTKECRPVPDIPYHRYAAQFMVDSQQERREVEVAASQFMDGYNNGADWVFHDCRYGTVREWDEARGFGFLVEDLTEQEVFVNRRAVKHQAEPKWRHNLRVGERVTFAKLGSKRGYWAVAVLRVPVRVPKEIWEEQPPSPCTHQDTPPRADSPTSGPVISGSVHAAGHTTVHLATHNYPPVPSMPAAKKLTYMVTRGESSASGSSELRAAAACQPPGPRFSSPIQAVTTADQRLPGFRYYEELRGNPYLHRGAAYSAIRGPGIRRVPPATSTRLGDKLFRTVI